jgi:mannose-6-phosphate isomerase
MSVRLLAPKFVERVWGTTELRPLFPDQKQKIGEVWFDAGPGFPLLIKFIFTSEKLSVQVHPDDEYARTNENCRGKTEMWHILAAKPGSTLALGFRETVTKDQLRTAIENETVEQLLNTIEVKPGDTYYTEAGIVHAIGAGITLCEIQQNSDVTYRLYDYGRGRELHLEKGLAVSSILPYDGARELPVRCRHFTTSLLDVSKPTDCSEGALIVLEGSGMLEQTSMKPGSVALLSSAATMHPNGPMKLLHTAPASQL